jgi:hypothetical protein
MTFDNDINTNDIEIINIDREDYNKVIKDLVDKNNILEHNSEFLYIDNIENIENYKTIIKDLQKKNNLLEQDKNNILFDLHNMEYEYTLLEKDLYDMEQVNTELIKLIKI